MLQISDQVRRGLIPLRGILLEALLDDPLELHRNSRAERRHRLGLLVHDRVERRLLILAGKCMLPRQHLIEHNPERPDVGPLIDLLPARLLRRHVLRRAERRARLRELHPGELREAEVDDLHETVFRDENIRRLDVAVNDPLAVRLGEPLGDLNGDIERLIELERPPLDLALEVLAVVVGHRDECLAVLRLSDLINRADVRVIERGCGARLMDEAFLRGGIAGELRREELERHGAAERRVLGLVDDPHPALAELLEDSVVG